MNPIRGKPKQVATESKLKTVERLGVSMPAEMAQAARDKSKRTGVRISFIFQRAIKQWLAERE